MSEKNILGATTVAKNKSSATISSPRYGTVQQQVSNIFTFHLDTELGEPHEYRDLSSILMSAEETDTINLIINGPGGYLNTCSQLVNLIRHSKAQVIGHLVGPSASAHTFIFLACHGWAVHPHSSMLLHSYSGGFYEKGRNIRKGVEATQTFFEDLVTEVYYPFLTEEEIDSILEGKDIHLQAKDILPRIDTLAEYQIANGVKVEE